MGKGYPLPTPLFNGQLWDVQSEHGDRCPGFICLFVCCCCFVKHRDKEVEGPLSNVLSRKDTLDGFKC